MVRAVDQRRLQVDHRVAGQDALGHRLAQPLLDGGDVLLRHDAADDLVAELEAGAHLGRRELDDDVPVLAVAAGLALELVVDPRRLADRLAVRHARAWRSCTAAPNLRFRRSTMTSTCASPMAVRIVSPVPSSRWIRDRGLLLLEPMQRLAELVEVGLRLRLDGDLERRRREREGAAAATAVGLVGDQRVAGRMSGELRDGRDVAGADLSRRFDWSLPWTAEEVADPLLLLVG